MPSAGHPQFLFLNMGKCHGGGLVHLSARDDKDRARGGFEELAENYRREAQVCRRTAGLVGGSQKEEWLRLSAEWIRLAKEADAMWWLT
jgi:hypothetical protein